MSDGASTRRRSIFVRLVAVVFGFVALVAVGIHISPSRGFVLRSVLPLAGRAGLIVRADSLRYNLFRLRATLTGVSVAATATPDAPFFEAGTVTVTAPPSVLRGLFSLTRIEILDGHVRIRRTAAGSNLPTSTSQSTTEPAQLRLGRITADLEVDIQDEVSRFSVNVPSMHADLSPGGGQLVVDGGQVGFRGETIVVTRMEGTASFDGRRLTFDGMNLATDVANVRLDGPLDVIRRSPSMDLKLAGRGVVARLTRLATPTRVFDGNVTFEGTLAGPFTAPVANFRVRSDRLDRDKLALTAVDLVTRVDVDGADISQATFGLAGGRVDTVARVAFDGTGSRVDGKWAGVDLPSLLTSLVEMPPSLLPAGSTSGSVTSNGTGFDLTRWTTAARMSLSGAESVRDRLGMPGQSQFNLRAGAWRLEGQHLVGDVAPVGFSLTGRIRPDGGVPLGGAIQVDATPVPALVSVLTRVGLADLPPSTFRAGSVSAAGTVGGDLTRPTLSGTAALAGVAGERFSLGPTSVAFNALPFDADVQLDARAESAEVAGQPLTMFDASARVANASITLNRFSAVSANPNVADGVAPGTIRGSGRYGFTSRAYELDTQVTNWLVNNGPNTGPARGLVNLTFAGAGTVDRPSGEGKAIVTDAAYADLALGTITVQARLDGQDANVDVDVPVLNLTGRGRTGLVAPYATTADVSVAALDLATLQPLVARRNVPLNGRATADAHAEGNLATWRDATVTLNLASAEALLGDLLVALDGPATVTYASGTVGTVRLAARAGGLQADVRGSLPIDPSPTSSAAMTMTLIGDVGDMLAAVRSTRLVDVPELTGTGPVAVMARVGGAVRSPELTADVDLGPASLTAPDLPVFERVRLLGHVENGRAEVQDLFVSVDGAELTGSASAPLSWASASLPLPAGASTGGTLSARLKNVTAGLLARLATGATVPDLEGSLDAVIELTSATPGLTALTGEARIERLDVSAAGLAITQAQPTRITAGGGVARIASWNWTGEGSQLSVDGEVRLSNLEAGITANGNLDLRLLSPFLRSSGVTTVGRLTPRLAISGPLNRPLIDGDLVLTGTDVRLASPRVYVSGLNGRAVFNRNTLEIESLDGSINGGALTLDGRLSFAARAPIDGVLTADIRGMALEYPEGLRTELDGSLNLTLRDIADGVDRVPFLSGAMRVVNGSYREQITVVGGLLAALQSRATAPPAPARTAAGRAPILALDVTVVTEEDIVVDNDAATLGLDLDVRLIGTAAQPVLSGRAEVRDGGRVLLGRNTYQVTSGTLDFANPSRIDPELNFQLTTRTGGTGIDVTVTGTASAPKLALASEDSPDLAQSDLTSLLLTGRTIDQLGSADAELVGNVLVGNLSGEVGQVLGLAGRVVGIDTIRLGGVDESILRTDPAAVATATDPTSRLTFAKALGSKVDVTFSQSLRNGDQQTWIVDYLPSRRLLARLVSNDQDLRSYEFRHDVQIGSSTRAREQAAASRIQARVSEVTISGLSEPDVSRLVSIEAGDRFDFGTLQDDRDRIEEYLREQGYLTARVSTRQMTTGTMVAVSFTIEAGPLARVEVAGTTLSQRITDEVAQLWADSLAGPLLIEEARTLVSERLAEQGYLRATVTVRLAETDGVQVLTVAVEPGPQTVEVSVVLVGVADDLNDELSRQLWVENLVPLAPRNPQAIVESLERGLRDRGYLEPRVVVAMPVYTGETAVVTATVQTGDRILLGPVTVTGSTLPLEDVQRALDLTEGLSYLQEAVDNAQVRLTSFYRQEGYPNATVQVQTVARPADRVIGVNVTVKEGSRQVVTIVRVEGLRRIAYDVAVRAMDLDIGQTARAEDLLRARTRLFATGLFRRVDVEATAAEDPPAAANELPMRVVATVEEWPTLRFRYGLQVAEERPDEEGSRRELVPGISADATRRTLFGRAISVGGATVLQRRSRVGRVFVSSPTFFSRPLRSSLVLQKEREEFASDNVSDVTRVSWEQRAKVFTHLDLVYSYRYERVHSFVDAPPDPNFPPFDVSLKIARLTGSAAWDSRNEPSAPVRGSLFTFSIEDSPEILGSDIRFFRYFAQARHFRSWRGTVFASSLQYGRVNPLGGQEVIPTERFYTGGDTSVRGLPHDGAGEQGPFGPVGGRVLLLLNQEARIPLHRWFQGVTFVDAGNVFAVPGDTSFASLVTSVGAGVRVVTPFALLRVDYGHVVRGGPDGVRGRWSFGIGHVF